jgi:ABC-type lipoprotein export system ATPase subunit
MIKVHNLKFNYPDSEFHLGITEMSVMNSEKIAVIGASGIGKTTLLNLIAGILTPDKGAVNVIDVEVNKLNDAERRNFRINNIGFVFQDFELIDYLNVLDNILHPYRITDTLKLTADVKARAKKLADEMGIADKLKSFPEKLSQGEKQRAAICRALLTEPKLILADEATGNLDPENKIRILDLLFGNVEKNNTTLLAVTHDHDLLPKFDRVIDFRNFRQQGNA